MKTRTLAAFILLCNLLLLAQLSYAQPAAGLGIGYNFGAGGGRIGSNSDNMYNYTATPSTYNYTEDGVYGSWGQGFDIDAWFEDMLCECFGIGAELSYSKGKKFSFTDNYTYTYPTYTENRVENYTGSLNTFSINPYIKLQCCEYFGIRPYGRLGLGINLMNTMVQKYNETISGGGPTSGDVEVQEAKMKGKLNLSLDAAAGFRYGLGGGLNLYGELNYNTRSFMTNKWELTKYTVNGADELGQLTTSQKETEFSKSYNSNATSSSGSPSQALAYKSPSSYLGLRVGIAYEFAGHKATPKGTEHR